MTALDPVGDRAIRQAQLNPPPEPTHALLHQLVHPFNHGGDPSRTEHDKREPVTHVEPRRLAGLMRPSLRRFRTPGTQTRARPGSGRAATRVHADPSQEHSCPWFRGSWYQPACVMFAMMHHLDCVRRTAGARQRR